MNREDFIRRLAVEPPRSTRVPEVLDSLTVGSWKTDPEVGKFYEIEGVRTRLFCRTARIAFHDFVSDMLDETEEAFNKEWKDRALHWLRDYGVQSVVWSVSKGGAAEPLHGWTLIVYFNIESATRKMFADAKVEVEV